MWCSYKNCNNTAKLFSSLTFFSLPNDHRRPIWIKNSGNELLQNEPIKSKKVFCEKHFDPRDMRKQFTRTILRQGAVPFKYGDESELIDIDTLDEDIPLDETINKDEDEQCNVTNNHTEENKELTDDIEFIYVIEDRLDANASPTKISLPVENSIKTRTEKECPHDHEMDESSQDLELNEIVETDEHEIISNNTESINAIFKTFSEDDDATPITAKRKCVANKFAENHQNSTAKPDNKQQEISLSSDQRINSSEIRSPVKTMAQPLKSLNNIETNDEETYFALSLIGTLKRLPPHKRALAKCHIINYLTELEYGKLTLS